VAEHSSKILVFEMVPSLLLIVCTPFQREQLNRTPSASLTLDTTFNITADGLKLTMFVVRSAALLDRFFPIMYCIHRRLDSGTYERIFLCFFKQFGCFGKNGFTGVTVDFDDSISSGYAAAFQQLSPEKDDGFAFLRMCKFHFLKNLLSFIRSGGATPKIQGQVIETAQQLITVASQSGSDSTLFQQTESNLFNILSRFPGFEGWRKWWTQNNQGLHWRCIFDVGPNSTRHHLYDTTNPSESQNRVIKLDHGLSQLPSLALLEILSIQEAKERQYLLALGGHRLASSYKRTTTPKKKAMKKATEKKHKDKDNNTAQKRTFKGHGPPKTTTAYKAVLKNDKKPALSEKTQKSFPLWKWNRNSCAYDSVLLSVFFALRSLPNNILSSLRTEAREATVPTRSSTKSPIFIRQCLLNQAERLGFYWNSAPQNFVEELGVIRNEFRMLVAEVNGLSDFDARNSFTSAADLVTTVCQALSLSNGSSPPSSSSSTEPIEWRPHEKVITPELVVRRKLTSIESMLRNNNLQNQVLIAFEFMLFDHHGRRLPGIDRYDTVEIPLIIHLKDPDVSFKFLACIDASPSHFRSHILIDPISPFQVQGKSVEPGMYFLDPYTRARAERSGSIPESTESLRELLPKVRGAQYLPHLFIYYRINDI